MPKVTGWSELELARAALEGDGDADRELLVRVEKCMRYLIRKKGWWQLARPDPLEDLVSEARVRLLRRVRAGFDGVALQFRSFLYAVVHSVAVDEVLRAAGASEVSLDEEIELPRGGRTRVGDFVLSTVGGPEGGASTDQARAVELTELRARVHSAVAALDVRCQRLVRGAHLEGRSIEDLAAREGMKRNAVEGALHRCRERLARLFLLGILRGGSRELEAKITALAGRLPAELAAAFTAWWSERLPVRRLAQRVGLTEDEARRRLVASKLSLWRLLEEGSHGAP